MADEDQFDRLPDHLLLLVLSSLPDAHSLALSSLVSRRFRSLSSQVTSLLLRLPPPPPAAAPKPSLLHRLHRLLLSAFHLLLPPSPKPSLLPPASPSTALRPFPHLRHLRLLLPAPELPPDHAALIRWRADFGSSLRRCAILAASSLSDSPAAPAPEDSHLCANGGLKSRVVWTISSLLAASARHRLLRPIAEGHPALRAAEIADAEGQGVLRMDAGQLEELRATAAADGDAARTAVPALSMRLWYSGRVEAGSGVALEGATLVAIRPAAGNDAEEVDEDWVAEAFGQEYGSAARALMKGKAYCLEMNSF